MSSEGIAQHAPSPGWGAPSQGGAEAHAARPSQSFSQHVAGLVLRRWTARIGLIWIFLLVIAAVFAPFLANSRPLAMKTADAGWSSPLLQHLATTDIALLVAFFTAVAVAFVRTMKLRQRAVVVLWMVAVTIPLAIWPTVAGEWEEWRREWGTMLLYLTTGFSVAALSTIIVIVPLLSRLSMMQKLTMGCAALVLAVLFIGIYPVRPPFTVFERYREMAAAGQIEQVYNAPVPYSPRDRLRDMPQRRLNAPSQHHWMGTEQHGADVLSRMIHATRIALAIGFIATGIALVIGVIIGGVMGYFVRLVDLLGMRLLEIFEAIPTLFLLITFVAFFGRNLYIMMAIIGLTGWTGYARYIRAEFLKLRTQDFVQAAIAAGLPLRSVLFRHMLPNGMAPVLVSASFGVASAILAESTLSFLGLGLVDEPSWGQMLNQVRAVGTFQWWIALFPGLAIFLTVFAYNLVGEALRDAIDPKTRKMD
jgi:peptide/nickel transport system permease protein